MSPQCDSSESTPAFKLWNDSCHFVIAETAELARALLIKTLGIDDDDTPSAEEWEEWPADRLFTIIFIRTSEGSVIEVVSDKATSAASKTAAELLCGSSKRRGDVAMQGGGRAFERMKRKEEP